MHNNQRLVQQIANYFICQLFYMELSNFNSLGIGAHICEDIKSGGTIIYSSPPTP